MAISDSVRFKYHKKPPLGEHHQNAAGRVYVLGHWEAARDKAKRAPASLTDEDLGVIESFDSTDAADAAAAARQRAHKPPTPPVTSPPADAPISLARATEIISKIFYPKPDQTFNRDTVAANARAERARDPAIVPGAYDPVAFTVAQAQFRNDPARLTDEDIAQLALVDRHLGDQAHASRAGYAKTGDARDSLDVLPVSLKALMEFVAHVVNPYIYSLRRLARETHVRVDALEQRLVDPKDGSAALSRAVEHIKALTDRVKQLEARPTMAYQGTFESGKTYKPGDCVTFKNSSWVAHVETRDPPTFDVTIGPKPWQLLVRNGRDGKDASGLR